MPFIGDLVGDMIYELRGLVNTILRTLVLNPLEKFVKGLMGFLQDVMVSTPYPKTTSDGKLPAVTGEPENPPWGSLYDLFNNTFQPYAYLLLFIIVVAGVFVNIIGKSLNMNDLATDNVNSKFFTGFLLVTFWWYLGTLILATSNALTQLLMSSVSGGEDPNEMGLVTIWEAVSKEFAGDNASVGGTVMLIPLALLWIVEALILLVIASLWVVRLFVIFVLMPVMPLFIAFYTISLPGFDKIQELGADALKWFVSLAFITLPAAIVVAVSGRIINQVLSYGTESMLGGGPDPESLSGYDPQQVIAHPQVGDTVYGDGVAGLGATDPQQSGMIAALGGILFAMLIVLIVPLVAGLAPFILFRSEAVDLGQGAINPAAAAADKAASVKSSADGVRERMDESDGMKDAMSSYYEDMEETVAEGDDGVKANLNNNMGATFGVAAGKLASETQDRTNQIKSGAEAGAQKAKSGMVRADNAQMMIRENRGEVTDIMRNNARETMKKKVNPHKQKARMKSLSNAPENARENFANKVQEQKNSIESRVEERREKKQRFADMSNAEMRQRLETKEYTPEEDDLQYLLDQDSSVVDAETKNGMMSEISGFAQKGRAGPDQAVNSLLAMKDSIRSGLEGTDIDAEPYLDDLDVYRKEIMAGNLDPDDAMDAVLEMQERIEAEVVSDEEVHEKYNEIDEQYEKFGANMSAEEFANQSLSASELKDMPALEEVIGGYAIRDNRMKEALEETGYDDMANDGEQLAELKEDPERLAKRIGVDTFNYVSERFEATEDLDIEEAASNTDLSRSELRDMDVDDLFSHIDEKFQENGEFNGVSSRKHLQAMKQDMINTRVVAEEEYTEQMMKDMVNNAPTQEAAVTLLENRAGVLLEESEYNADELQDALGIDARERGEILETLDEEDIVSELIEQDLNGEEISSGISEHFHEEFEDATEMLEHIGTLREARGMVEEMSEDIKGLEDEPVIETDDGEVTLGEISDDPSSVASQIVGGDMEALESEDGVDVDTLESFGIDMSEEDVITDDDIEEMRGKLERGAVRTIESQVKDSVMEDMKELEGDDYEFEDFKEDLGYDEITAENASEFAKKASLKSTSKKVREESEKKIRGEIEEQTAEE